MNKTKFEQWQAFALNIRARAERLANNRIDEAYRLAATVGIPRCGCSLHNASIDREMKGWCKDNPQRLKVARRANWMATEWAWQPTRLASNIIQRALDKVMKG